jgi:hypothetical protein
MKNETQSKLTKDEIINSILQGIERKTAEDQDFTEATKAAIDDNSDSIRAANLDPLAILAEDIAERYPDKTEAIKKIYNSLPNPQIKTWREFENSIINYDDSKDYKSSILQTQRKNDKDPTPRRFPAGTLSYIGGRPSRGKTTVLASVALDGLKQRKKVVFVTAEETTKQLLIRLIKCYAYADNHKTAARYIFNQDKTPTKTLCNYIKDRADALDTELLKVQNADRYSKAYDSIMEYYKTNALTIYETFGASYNELINYLSMQPAGALIVIDYIQHLKAPDKLVTQSRQIQIQEISHSLQDIACKHGLIIISGAQFGRGDNKDDLSAADFFTEAAFRECGDIEQDGHILIGLGRQPDKDNPENSKYYYSCMKDREASPDGGQHYRFLANMSYSYMTSKIEQDGTLSKFEPIRPEAKKKTAKAKTTTADNTGSDKGYY